VLASLGLPVSYPAAAWPDLLAAMRVDKKARGLRPRGQSVQDMPRGQSVNVTLRFVVLDGIARPSILEGPSDEQLAAAYQEVCS
jgi:3-dehydroquinate synthase